MNDVAFRDCLTAPVAPSLGSSTRRYAKGRYSETYSGFAAIDKEGRSLSEPTRLARSLDPAARDPVEVAGVVPGTDDIGRATNALICNKSLVDAFAYPNRMVLETFCSQKYESEIATLPASWRSRPRARLDRDRPTTTTRAPPHQSLPEPGSRVGSTYF
jgi:hypothetical protein